MKLFNGTGDEYWFTRKLGSKQEGCLILQKPEPKKIDMSVCIKSGIDCEFTFKGECRDIVVIDRLKKITGDFYMVESAGGGMTERCRPRFNHIHASPNGWDECPIPEGFTINWWGYESNGVNDYPINWGGTRMFEVTGIAEGYTL